MPASMPEPAAVTSGAGRPGGPGPGGPGGPAGHVENPEALLPDAEGFWSRARRRPGLLVAAGVLLLLYALVWVLPPLLHLDPDATNPLASLAPPGPGHWLGTDELGRDMLARMLAGGRITLTVAALAAAIALSVGTLVGALAGFYRGGVETVLMRFVDAMMAIPSYFLIVAELAVLGDSPAVVVAVIGLNYWMPVARLVYAEFLKWREREFIEAEIALGASPARIIWRHLFPQVVPSLLALLSLTVGWAVLAESGLSYLGLGIQPPDASWGNMLKNAQTYMWTQPLLAVYPGAAILVTVLCFNVLGNGLRDVLDPRDA
ncbi:binding-protein-dependent transport systems inner membrane component [Thermaerobacter marianensis DSM 12885]|uniref:Binding-protein-dependent transport systems inner membrane component n=1 Tax=Thermaerobacter marianensis (strain ATCC 700841 / DSM 12885 / JCM 10246 / 7p75a) TaxID=644966 RepID=E6SI24_THEM7|nr:ABC transporter permease [Thermaerobacter marianensis]ADU50802.1 binding-protein-dependent transport systems inner membrane component [Thermaerobacter marianensis DSM 12885]